MKRYLVLSLLVVLVLASGSVMSCGQNQEEQPPFAQTPRGDSGLKIAQVLEYLKKQFGFERFWAQPRFPMDKWSAEYQEQGKWLVRVYDIDGAYAGTWLVSPRSSDELAYSIEDFVKIEPYDKEAEAVESREREFAKMPPRPPFIKVDLPAELMIQAVQTHIVHLSPKVLADQICLAEIRKLILDYYPLEWHVTYTDSSWIVTTTCGEYRARAFVDPQTGDIAAFGELAW